MDLQPADLCLAKGWKIQGDAHAVGDGESMVDFARHGLAPLGRGSSSSSNPVPQTPSFLTPSPTTPALGALSSAGRLQQGSPGEAASATLATRADAAAGAAASGATGDATDGAQTKPKPPPRRPKVAAPTDDLPQEDFNGPMIAKAWRLP